VAEEFSGKMSVMMNSPQAQSEFIEKAYMGLYDPNEPEVKVDAKKEVENDLGLVDAKDKPKEKASK
jgi:hypothetical protein